MTTPSSEKVSITLPPDLIGRARAASGRNFSGFIAQAIREKLMADSMAEYARLHGSDSIDDVYDAIEADAA